MCAGRMRCAMSQVVASQLPQDQTMGSHGCAGHYARPMRGMSNDGCRHGVE
jgi:hypothetical protein